MISQLRSIRPSDFGDCNRYHRNNLAYLVVCLVVRFSVELASCSVHHYRKSLSLPLIAPKWNSAVISDHVSCHHIDVPQLSHNYWRCFQHELFLVCCNCQNHRQVVVDLVSFSPVAMFPRVAVNDLPANCLKIATHVWNHRYHCALDLPKHPPVDQFHWNLFGYCLKCCYSYWNAISIDFEFELWSPNVHQHSNDVYSNFQFYFVFLHHFRRSMKLLLIP